MKILGVRFQNLNSLKGEHEIRFDQAPLAEAGLFAITGPTGAGKTTILDAITVGLYGLVHRHNQDRPLDLMTRHTAEAYAEVEFEAGGQCYRSKWSLRRSRSKADGKLQPIHMELYDLANKKFLDLKPSQVPEVVAEISGLDYSQFLRSVMLSQGDFARFLKAKDNERSSLLEKITDTGVYSDISRFAFEKAKAERRKAEELERQLQAQQLLPEEERQAYLHHLEKLEEQQATLKGEQETLQQHLRWIDQLKKLQLREVELKEELALHQQRQEHLQPEFRRLEKHEQARRYQTELSHITYTGTSVAQIGQRLAQLEKTIPQLVQALEQARLTAKTAQKAKEAQEESLRQLEPVLEKVMQADSEISSLQSQYLRSQQACHACENALLQEEKELKHHQSRLLEITRQGVGLRKWLEENTQDRDLQANLDRFREMLRDLKEVEQHRQRLQKEQAGNAGLLQAEELKQQKYHKQEMLLGQKLDELQEKRTGKLTLLQTLLAGQEVEALEKAAQTLPDRLQRLSRQHHLALEHTRQEEERRQVESRMQEQETEASQTQSTLTSRQQELRQGQELLAALHKVVEQQARIQELEQARHLLQPGQECPLCGSVHHPFVENNYVSSLSAEEARRDAQHQQVERLQEEVGQLLVRHSNLRQSLQADQQRLHRLTAGLELLTSQFQGLNEELQTANAITDAPHLANLVESQQKSQTALQETLSQVRSLSRENEALGQQHHQEREALLKVESQQEHAAEVAATLRERLQQIATEIQDLEEQWQAFSTEASSFAASYGLAFHPARRSEALQTLENRCTRYQEAERQRDELREPYLQAKADVQRLEKQEQKSRRELTDRKEALQKDHQALQKLKEERQALFGDQDPATVRQQQQQVLRLRSEQEQDARTALLRQEQDLQEQRKRQSECQAEHSEKMSLLEQLRTTLLAVLQPEGIETIEALGQMLLDQDEATRLTNLQQQTQKRLIELRTSLANLQQELLQTAALSFTTLPEEALRQELQDKSAALAEVLMKRGRVQQLLEQDARRREEHQEIAGQLQTQQQVCRRWENLSALIGSADGNKFSRFAQGLTLARLVELANGHLQKLNDRYRILKNPEEDLELLVVDTYQAEAVRPMNTLSGGESFLVSLALALGLSDLAGRRTQIRSLFIDEGFGTLDTDTLDTAISTLENLQADGKTIGIISHVEALKERIATQIRVRRLPGGVSKIEVVGYAQGQ